jgi:hypothetical protein
MNIRNRILVVSAITLMLTNNLAYAEVAHGVLEKYKKNSIFVSTGIYSCISLARALNAGFRELHGIDEDEVLVNHAKTIFPHEINQNLYNVKNYTMHHGGAAKLEKVIAQINSPITFLLSSHFPDIDQVKPNNILQELDVINNHPIKTHTILIDYIQHANTARFGDITLEAILEKLREINPRYLFAFEKGGHLEEEEKAILVAYMIN